MRPPRVLILAFFGAVAVYLLAASAYRKGYDAGRDWGLKQMQRSAGEWLRRAWQEEVDVNGSRAQTQDAVHRWIRKNAAHSGMRGRYPHVSSYGDKNCIQFRLAPGSVGGEPTYCYRANTLQLIEEHSDVQ
jgi:hypothetical protein